MRHRTHLIAGSVRPAFSICIACALAASATLAAAAQGIKPPPLPPGSSMVRIQAGMSPDEVKRQVRAHHHKGHFHKDLKNDDSAPKKPEQQGGTPATNPGKKP